jgi:hypothetical protein
MKFTVDIEDTDVVVASLKQDYKWKMADMTRLERVAESQGIRKYQLEDYVDAKEILDALKKVLSYYMVGEDFRAFMMEPVEDD